MKVTAIKQQVKRAGRYSIFVDGKYAFSLSESALIQGGLAPGRELDATELEDLKKAAGLDKAYNNALRYVALRPRSEWELEQYFRRKIVDEHASEQIISRLRSLGFVDDAAFARTWVANRRLLKATSRRKLILELKQKHISEDTIQTVLAQDESNDHQALRELITKKRRRYPDNQKLMQYLARQGFGYDDIKSVLAES